MIECIVKEWRVKTQTVATEVLMDLQIIELMIELIYKQSRLYYF